MNDLSRLRQTLRLRRRIQARHFAPAISLALVLGGLALELPGVIGAGWPRTIGRPGVIGHLFAREKEPDLSGLDPTIYPEERVQLVGGTEALFVLLDPGAPTGTWVEGAREYSLRDPRLTIDDARSAGEIYHGRTSLPRWARVSYRLRFSIDRCEGEASSVSPWSPCWSVDGDAHWLETRELLVELETMRWESGEVHNVAASCIPQSARGPSCTLRGGSAHFR